MKNMFLLLGGVVLVLAIMTFLTKSGKGQTFNVSQFLPNFPHPSVTPVPTPTPNIKTIKVANTVVMVTVADTDAARMKGLGGVKQMLENQGMLFVFTKRDYYTFWMKDMLIPLDFIWINNNSVSKIDPNIAAPAPNTPDAKLQRIESGQPIDHVLEVNSGFAAKHNIKVGNPVSGL